MARELGFGVKVLTVQFANGINGRKSPLGQRGRESIPATNLKLDAASLPQRPSATMLRREFRAFFARIDF